MLAIAPLLIALTCLQWAGARSQPARLPHAYRKRQANIDPALVLDFGVQRGVPDPNGSASCVGVKPGSLIPCSCPPDRDEFVRLLSTNVAAGHAVKNPSVAVSFPTSSSQADQLTRLHASTVTLQNLNGPGQAATNFASVEAAIRAGTSTPSSSASPVTITVTPTVPGNSAGSGVDRSLVVDFGVTRGIKDPNGSASCVGIKGVLIPCQCPPDFDSFVDQLSTNVALGHAQNNTGVALAFPTSSSKVDRLTRMHAQTVTLQNLRGPGVGCPQAATNWSQVVADIQAS